jgi:VanZ family protein
MGGDGPHATRTPVGAGRTVSALGPPLALMGLIWYLSAQSHLATDLGWIDTVLRKGAHMTEYAALTLLWARALLLLARPADGRRDDRVWWAAAGVALAWAVVDEVHQHHVPGRVGTPRDVGIDAAGIVLAVAAGRLLRR